MTRPTKLPNKEKVVTLREPQEWRLADEKGDEEGEGLLNSSVTLSSSWVGRWAQWPMFWRIFTLWVLWSAHGCGGHFVKVIRWFLGLNVFKKWKICFPFFEIFSFLKIF